MAPSRTGRLLPPPEATTPACTLPHDLLLEIVARSDVVTVVRSAATCKPLRRDILSPGFIRRVCQHGPNGGVVPPFLVGYLRVDNKAGWERAFFSLVHPATPAATSFFSDDHLAPFLSRRDAAGANGLGKRYRPLTSRNGLVVLRRGWSGICVYDPMTGNQACLPHPPNIGKGHRELYGVYYTYVLLTAADGIGCSFLVLATDSRVSCIQAAWSDAADGTSGWGPVISVAEPDRHRGFYCGHSCAVVLNGLIHWLLCIGYASPPNMYIRTYDVPRHGTRAVTTTGSIEVPKACLPDRCEESDVHLTSSPDGRLSLLVADRFTISVWLLSGSGSTGRWARQSVIDTEPIVLPVSLSEWPSNVDFVTSLAGVRSGAVLLRPFMSWDFLNDKGKKGLLLVDVGTEEMRRVNKKKGFPYEVDMEARLSAMKIFD